MTPRYRLLAGLLLAFVAAAWFDRHPLPWPVSEPGAEPGLSEQDTGHPVLLVVASEALRGSRPRHLAERWADLEWANLLTQAYGGCDLLGPDHLGSALHNRELVVVPRRSAAALAPSHIAELGAAVRSGLHVIFEAPDSTRCQRFGLELASVERRQRLPWPRPVNAVSGSVPTLRPEPVQVEWTRFRYAPPPLSRRGRPSVHLSLDGRPLGWVREEGEGSWIVLAMDFAELATRLRQGSPGEDLRIRPAHGAAASATDLVDGFGLAGADQAWLDAWVEGVFGGALTTDPIVRIATAPFDSDGWLLLSAEQSEDAPAVAGFADASGHDAPKTASGLLSWWVADGAPAPPEFLRPLGIGPVHPVVRRVGIVAQARRFAEIHGAVPTLNRIHSGTWSRNPDQVFAAVQAAGIGIDCSLGASGENPGWSFGSGVPFVPLATDGTVFSLLEIPVHWQGAQSTPDERRLSRWLRYNARGGASPVHLFLDGTTNVEALDRLAARYAHARARPDELARWWRDRSDVRVRTRPSPEGVEVRVENPGDGSFALMVPVRWRDRALLGWASDWGSPPSRRVRRFDRAYRLIKLDPGAAGGVLRLRYE